MSQPFLALITPLTGGMPHPEHPIVIPPTNGQPPASGQPPRPTHPIPPIVWPNPPEGTPPPGGEKPPSGELPQVLTWHTVWTEQYGWALVGVMSTGVAPSQQKG